MATHKHNNRTPAAGRHSNPGASLTPGAWSLEPGASLTPGAWSLEPEASLTPGAWSLEPGACSPRRGVILLVLLGMLALFAATAFAFVVIASHGKRTAKSLQRVDRVSFSARVDLEEALRQLLVGTNSNDTSSVLRHQSLLEDLYGADTIGGWVINGYTVAPASSGATHFKGKDFTTDLQPGVMTPPTAHQSPLAGGQIIEFTAGYTLPAGSGYYGGLYPPGNASEGQLATTGNSVGQTLTIPEWFGENGSNGPAGARQSNPDFEFRRRVGCVLTVVDPSSALYNKSTRIIGYYRVPVTDARGTVFYHRYQVLPFEGVSAAATVGYFSNTQSSGADFIINGVPFSGTGAGYDSSSGTNDKLYNTPAGSPIDLPYALLPNPTDPDYYDELASTDRCSANEDYDAPDYQNMLLALEEYDGTAMLLTRSPSLHRPALANYWLNQLYQTLVGSLGPEQTLKALIQPNTYGGAYAVLITAVKRRCLLRPLAEDHANFDGSNTNWPTYSGVDISGFSVPQLTSMAKRCWGIADLVPGSTYPWFVDANSDGIPDQEVVPWDVDNDGDGLPDSIWVDIGLPLRTLPDGRKYRPLVAIHCIDLDGKINLNTAGSVEQLVNRFRADPTPGGPMGYLADNTAYAPPSDGSGNPTPLADGSAPAYSPVLFRGQGAGAAEIWPLPITSAAIYRNLLHGDSGAELDGRYGELRRRGADLRRPSPGFTPSAYSYYTNPSGPEKLLRSRLLGYPANYFYSVANRNALAYGSPLDLKGTMALGLDLFGQPIYSAMGGMQYDSSNNALNVAWGWNNSTWAATGFDTPYELRLGTNAAQSVDTFADIDNPFTVAELEPLLRRADADVDRLPDRLSRLLQADASSLYRIRATTESWDIPVPGMAMPEALLTAFSSEYGGKIPSHPTDLIAAKLLELQANHTSELPGGGYFYPRPKNVDFSTLLSTDLRAGLRMDLNRAFGNGLDSITIDTDGDGNPDSGNGVIDEPNEPGDPATTLNNYRLAYARTLYVLAMALVDPDWYPYWDYYEFLRGSAGSSADPTSASGPTRHEARARALAQWAVNVVDYRDPDSIMTGFAYDPYPFAIQNPSLTRDTVPDDTVLDTWNVDGTRVVWGCERPELVITESMATHDRRQVEVPSSNPVEYITDFRPEGALFVELFNPNTPAEPVPGEFGVDPSTYTNVGGVRLNQTTATGGDPVWRLAVYDVHKDANFMPDEFHFLDPRDSETGPTTPRRLVYFVPDSGSLPQAGSVDVAFSTSSGTPVAPILPRRYAVIGPGDLRNDDYGPASGGSGVKAGVTLLGELPPNYTTARRIEIVPNANANTTGQVRIFADGMNDQVNQLVTDGVIHPPVGVLIDQPQRLSISEPNGGYAADADAGYDWRTGYPVGTDHAAEDLNRSDDLSFGDDTNGDTIPDQWTRPVSEAGTTAAVFYVHIERLANPLIPYNATTNPYISVDASPVDLTVFDSASDPSLHQLGSTRPYPQAGTQDAFFTRQRGEEQTTLQESVAEFWRPLLVKPVTGTGALPLSKDAANLPVALGGGAAPHTHFNGPINHTLGFLNEFYCYQIAGDTRFVPADFGVDNAYRGAPGRVDSGTSAFESRPFPWLPWINRPFANPLELLQVPDTPQTRLLFAYQNDTFAENLNLPYVAGQQQFGHLAPFFSAIGNPTTSIPEDDAAASIGKFYAYDYDLSHATDPDAIPNVPSPDLYRILEYVNVPSRFVDAQTEGANMDVSGENHFFHSPNKFIPAYREPGKLNLNTIAEEQVLRGLFSDHFNATIPGEWDSIRDAFWASRRGFPATGADYFGFETVSGSNPPLPTRMANPFRSAAGLQFVPPVPGRDAGGTNPPYLAQTVIQQGVNATLLRARVNSPMSQTEFNETLVSRRPLFTAFNDSLNQYDDCRKNPYFQYQTLQRMSNLVTNRSNVYAVWITIGYFEAEPYASFDPKDKYHQQIYRDGYTLGKELGIDEGNVTRHRSFYIIDRSIPVGYIPGKDLNTEKAILLRRFIE